MGGGNRWRDNKGLFIFEKSLWHQYGAGLEAGGREAQEEAASPDQLSSRSGAREELLAVLQARPFQPPALCTPPCVGISLGLPCGPPRRRRGLFSSPLWATDPSHLLPHPPSLETVEQKVLLGGQGAGFQPRPWLYCAEEPPTGYSAAWVPFACLFIIWQCWVLVVACGIQSPEQGWNWGPLHWEGRILATRYQGSPRLGSFTLRSGSKGTQEL